MGRLMRESNYCSDPKQVEIFAGVPEALERLERERLQAHRDHRIRPASAVAISPKQQYRLVEAEVARGFCRPLSTAFIFAGTMPDRARERRKPGPGMVVERNARLTMSILRARFSLATRRSMSSAAATRACAPSWCDGLREDATETLADFALRSG